MTWLLILVTFEWLQTVLIPFLDFQQRTLSHHLRGKCLKYRSSKPCLYTPDLVRRVFWHRCCSITLNACSSLRLKETLVDGVLILSILLGKNYSDKKWDLINSAIHVEQGQTTRRYPFKTTQKSFRIVSIRLPIKLRSKQRQRGNSTEIRSHHYLDDNSIRRVTRGVLEILKASSGKPYRVIYQDKTVKN